VKILSHILSYIFITLFIVKSALFSVTTYFFVNNNEELTALCCVNKDTDINCKAKCFLDTTKESSDQKETETQKVSFDFFEQEKLISVIEENSFSLREDNFYYSSYSPSEEKIKLVKPPIV